jgi:predicted nucleic acid-binding Zn ribbon protein
MDEVDLLFIKHEELLLRVDREDPREVSQFWADVCSDINEFWRKRCRALMVEMTYLCAALFFLGLLIGVVLGRL